MRRSDQGEGHAHRSHPRAVILVGLAWPPRYPAHNVPSLGEDFERRGPDAISVLSTIMSVVRGRASIVQDWVSICVGLLGALMMGVLAIELWMLMGSDSGPAGIGLAGMLLLVTPGQGIPLVGLFALPSLLRRPLAAPWSWLDGSWVAWSTWFSLAALALIAGVILAYVGQSCLFLLFDSGQRCM